MASSTAILGKSSLMEPTLKNQFLLVSFAISGGSTSLQYSQIQDLYSSCLCQKMTFFAPLNTYVSPSND